MENKMDICKDFAQKLRRVTMKEVYIILNDDITPPLRKYVRLLTQIPFEEGSYNAYYGAVKKIINSFINYYSTVIDRVIIDADKYTNIVDRYEIRDMMDRTINMHAEQQVDFAKEYLPVRSVEERRIYDEMQDMYDAFVQKMLEFRAKLEKIDKQDKADAFAQEHYKIAVRQTSDILDFTHTYIAIFLTERIGKIRISLEEIYNRLKKNLRKIEEKGEKVMNKLKINLYDQNKELMMISRQYRKISMEVAEITRTIDKTHGKIELFKNDTTRDRLEEEVRYWETRLHDFQEVATLITKLREDKDYVDKQREIYASRTCTELPGTKVECWKQIGINYDEKSEELRAKVIEAGKCLITFFGIRGVDRIFYKSDLGKYYVDEFNHQVYVDDFGLQVDHINCKGEFVEVSDGVQYYFDENGRYIKNEKGEKIYQVANCTSQYKLDENNLLKKITKDCGHSENLVKQCKMRIKDPNDVEVLPDTDKVDLHKKLEPEIIDYLWDNFGHVLPYALHDVCTERSKNPIHNLAHRLLYYKYEKTYAETEKKKKEAKEFRQKVYRDRQTKAAAASKAWKAKQVKRRKPEDSDDAEQRAALHRHVAMADFVNSLVYYYN